jgi:hypothetical protein
LAASNGLLLLELIDGSLASVLTNGPLGLTPSEGSSEGLMRRRPASRKFRKRLLCGSRRSSADEPKHGGGGS